VLEIAIQAVKIAGEILKSSSPDKIEKWTKDNNSRHIVSEIDYQIEAEVSAFLQKMTPEIDILGEEFLSPASISKNETIWVLDPLDGTLNYAQGLNHYSVSLALLKNGKPVVSAIYSPSNNELFTAIEGQGAFLQHLNNRISPKAKLKTSQKANLREGLICIEWGRTSASIQTGMAVLQRMAPLVREVRFLGGAALTLCYVAGGILDGYIDHDLDIWDYAAGQLIVEEAGGKLLKFAMSDDDILIAANRHLAPKISQSLADLLDK